MLGEGFFVQGGLNRPEVRDNYMICSIKLRIWSEYDERRKKEKDAR
jgi:hypothetical protein